MKALMIMYNQAFNEEILEILQEFEIRGFTRWTDVQGRGSVDGEPHLNSHAWPVLNHVMLSIVEDSLVENVLSRLKEKDQSAPSLGLRAFVWNIENCY